MKVTVTLWAFKPKGERGLTRLVADIICLWTRSPWFHVGISIREAHGGVKYVEARPFYGVVHQFAIPPDAVKVKSWLVDDDVAVEQWIERQIGKPYDWAGVFGFVYRPSNNGRADRGKWFCSELATVILRKFGIDVCWAARAQAQGWKWEAIPQWDIDPGELVKDVSRV